MVLVRPYDNERSTVGFTVNTYTTGSQVSPAISSDAAGNFKPQS